MKPDEAIQILEVAKAECEWNAPLDYQEAFEMAISALQTQDSKTRKICKTCKHDPPSKKWPCVDCDMREPADRWESQDVPDTNVGDIISRQAAIDALDVLCQEHRYRIPGKRETYSQYNEAWQDALDRAESIIGNLPSAQPVHHGETAEMVKSTSESSQNVPYDDLISRKAAIDAITSLCDDCDSDYCGSCRVNYPGEKNCRKVLEDLPSAQPDHTADISKKISISYGHENDLISRQVAIDALHMDTSIIPFKKAREYADATILEIRNRLKKLPPAQPEPKTGHWIPVDSYTAFGGDETTWLAHGNPIAYHYCSECKNHAYELEHGEDLLSDFCPSCGAKMLKEGE